MMLLGGPQCLPHHACPVTLQLLDHGSLLSDLCLKLPDLIAPSRTVDANERVWSLPLHESRKGGKHEANELLSQGRITTTQAISAVARHEVPTIDSWRSRASTLWCSVAN